MLDGPRRRRRRQAGLRVQLHPLFQGAQVHRPVAPTASATAPTTATPRLTPRPSPEPSPRRVSPPSGGYFVDFSENTSPRAQPQHRPGDTTLHIPNSWATCPARTSATSPGLNAVNEAYNAYVKAVRHTTGAEEQARPQNAELNKKGKEAQRAVDDLSAEYDELRQKDRLRLR